jgi:hypothetical protein
MKLLRLVVLAAVVIVPTGVLAQGKPADNTQVLFR